MSLKNFEFVETSDPIFFDVDKEEMPSGKEEYTILDFDSLQESQEDDFPFQFDGKVISAKKGVEEARKMDWKALEEEEEEEVFIEKNPFKLENAHDMGNYENMDIPKFRKMINDLRNPESAPMFIFIGKKKKTTKKNNKKKKKKKKLFYYYFFFFFPFFFFFFFFYIFF